MQATARSSTCSAPTSRRSDSSEPLVAGEMRSFFGMTEPEVAGSDPTLLRGRAERDGDEWVINAHKWFSSGADGAAFGDRHGRHRSRRRAAPARVDDPRPDRHAGLRARAAHPGDGPRGPRLGDALRDALHRRPRARVANMLGEPGDGFRIAQKRLGPGRIHHVMRWLGQMQRAFELMCALLARAQGVRRARSPRSRRSRTGSPSRPPTSRPAG